MSGQQLYDPMEVDWGYSVEQPLEFNSSSADFSSHVSSEHRPVVLHPSLSQSDNYYNPWVSRGGVHQLGAPPSNSTAPSLGRSSSQYSASAVFPAGHNQDQASVCISYDINLLISWLLVLLQHHSSVSVSATPAPEVQKRPRMRKLPSSAPTSRCGASKAPITKFMSPLMAANFNSAQLSGSGSGSSAPLRWAASARSI